MAQALPRYCPRCGTPTRADMQRCTTCGLPVEAMLSRPDNRQFNTGESRDATPQGAIVPAPIGTQQENEAQFPPPDWQQNIPPSWQNPGQPTHQSQLPPISPLPPTANSWSAPGQPGNPPSWAPPPQQGVPNPWSSPGIAYPPNNPANQAPSWSPQNEPVAPPPSPSPAPKRQLRTGRVFVILLILLLLAGGGYFAFAALNGHVPGLSASQSTIKTTSINGVVTYAGATITVLNVQQAQNFIDDPHSASDGMVRLNLRAQNTTDVPIAWDYQQSAQLIVQGKPALAPVYVKASTNLAPGASQTDVVDFAVANGGNLSTLIFQLGTAKEAQIQVPLNGQANLNQYQPKTTKQNGPLTYFGLNWTLTGSTTSLSIPGQQASSGMEFLTLNLTIDNTLSQQAISGSPFDYMRVKAGGKTSAPVSTTIPVSFATGVMGKTGTATFLIPQNSTACTLLLLSQDPGKSGQASVDFTIG